MVNSKRKLSKADLLLHPIRLRIVQQFLGMKELTVQQIAERLQDVPQATLYRHLNLLVQGSLLVIIRQNPVRGTIEKVYGLAAQGQSITPQDANSLPRDELMRHFMLFTSMLLNDFEVYLKRDKIDLAEDCIMFRQASFHMTNEEFMTFMHKLGPIFAEAMKLEPGPGRTRRTFSTISMPGKETNKEDESNA